MSEIPEIPDDIMKIAENTLDNLLCHDSVSCGGYDGLRKAAATDIALAILAERERAAMVAEDFFILPDTDTGPQIAAAIRKGR